MRTVLFDLGPLAHLGGNGALAGTDLLDYEHLTSPAGMAIVVNNGAITKIADSKELEDEYGSPQSGNKDVTIISLEGHAVVPGLVDGHNHLLWAGDRSNEITMKQQGMSYQSIAAAGGGIQHTVRELSLIHI